MRLRRKAAPLLLFLLPAIASAASFQRVKRDTNALLQPLKPRDLEKQDYIAVTTNIVPAEPSISVKARAGTKDAPVDGRDGKPHDGPFVDASSDTKTGNSGKIGMDSSTSNGQLASGKGSSKEETGSLEGNVGVMGDRDRTSPKEGTTGTEGGVSERTRKESEGSGVKVEKKPDPPKQAPPRPESDQSEVETKEKDKSSKMGKDSVTGEIVEKPKGAQGLEKPKDLPEKPHDIPHPSPNTGSIPKDSFEESGMEASAKTGTASLSGASSGQEEESGIIQPFHSFVLSVTMILFSEVGDKTFLVAALMAMRHPRLVVFSAAFSALIAMTVLSAVLGHAVPTLIPERYTHLAAAILFLVFGVKMVREGLAMRKDEGVGEEMKEVEMELEEKEMEVRKMERRKSSTISPYMLEAGRGRRSRSQSRIPAPCSPSSSTERSPERRSTLRSIMTGFVNLCSLLLSPAWVQTFVMTFLGEWGDRSQIATIAMAAGQDYWWVTGGAISGHAVCTGIAVIGGRAIAGRVSMRVVTLGGAFAFILFGLIYIVEAVYSVS